MEDGAAKQLGFMMLDMRSGADTQPQKPSLSDGAYDALKAAIRNNVFAPGYQGIRTGHCDPAPA